MQFKKTQVSHRQGGAVLIVSMILVLIFSALAVSLATFTDANAQLANNQYLANSALLAAQSGMECALYLASTAPLGSTGINYVTDAQANNAWNQLCVYLQTTALAGQSVGGASRFTDSGGSGDQILINNLSVDGSNTDFTIRYYRYDGDPRTVKMQSVGTDGAIARKILMDTKITKDSDVLNYAIASRGRMWLTGDTTIHGDIYSSWDRAEISPFNMTSDSAVEGTINTVLTLNQIEPQSYQMETLDANGLPLDVNGNPLGTNYADRYYSPDDEIQGYHEGVGYGKHSSQQMAGMDISDYDTSLYHDRTVVNTLPVPTITTTETYYDQWTHTYKTRTVTKDDTVTEYFPHGSDGYNDYKSGARTLTRYVYENETFTDAYLPSNRNALFENCTFEGVLYIDCSQYTSSYYNNVRFNDCTFNGVIVTNTPDELKWQYNTLYFTGKATFSNQSNIQEATILAPHFNVNLGNTNPEQSDNNILTGAIVGGIVDVRGNAQIYGTIISMCDTTQWSSGYVTNIGATLDDGGSETTQLGDIGVINITPETEQMLPSGITSPIIIKPMQTTYSEGV